MDFYRIKTRHKNAHIEVYPDFKVGRSKDLMVRGQSFYAIWNPHTGLWSTDEYDTQVLVDADLAIFAEELKKKTEADIRVYYMSDFANNTWAQFRRFMKNLSDNSHQLDKHLTFQNTEVQKTDYVSKRLPYSVEEAPCDSWVELISTLYESEEQEKIEWAIGSVVAGDSIDIQKFLVLYGEAGAGKSTILNIIQKLFEGYYTTFEAKALVSASNAFSTEVFRNNPLVAIQHDGDLSRIEDNTKLNSIISHEEMTMNEKYKPTYTSRINCFLFMASNKPVKITDAKSGIIRRLIDVRTSGRRIPAKHYQTLLTKVDFELGAIAHRCLTVYRERGKNYYSGYRPVGMMYQTDIFFNFIEDHYHQFKHDDGVSLSKAYAMYKEWCAETEITYKLPRYKFRDELANYFESFQEIARIDEHQVRSYFSGFLAKKLESSMSPEKLEKPNAIVIDQTKSLLDDICADRPAQYATRTGVPGKKWAEVTTTLKELNTKRIHYVQLESNHVVIDFDLKDETGEKSLEANIEAASKWPATYTELSKSGLGIHLHYIYTGDPDKLSGIYSEGIEVKVSRGNAALRRRLTKCNNIPISNLQGGLPLKGEPVISFDRVKSEQGLRRLIERNLQKEIHPATKPSVDFIFTILEDAIASGLVFDVTDMRSAVLAFAANSTNNSKYCVNKVSQMRFRSEAEEINNDHLYSDDTLVFFDIEVFPNLLVVGWKPEGETEPIMIVNPEPNEIENFLKKKLVGFNCRRYDNHILYARFLGYSLDEIYNLSVKIINDNSNVLFREAYNLSYADIYDFASEKKSLKKWEVALGLKHNELNLPWNEPVKDEDISTVLEYCADDVRATERVFEDRAQDFVARKILADLSGLPVNSSTLSHTSKIIFGNAKNPQDRFVYTDLSEEFPGYVFDNGKSSYLGEDPGEGGYVYAEPGIHGNVALLDIASMHPTTIEVLNLFGPYTKRYSQIKDARLAIKHKNYEGAKGMLGGVLEKYLVSEEDASALAYALKIIINIVYGLTSARFDNAFRDIRNKDNIVAKRGALFMINLKREVQERGFTVVHCKTDSIKIADATQGIIDFVFEYGKKYGYDFEHEATYNKIALVNQAVYIARYSDDHPSHPWAWTATGAQFAHPYVFKRLFSKEDISFRDLCEVKSVTTEMWLDFNETLPEDEHKYVYVGKVGIFTPVLPGTGGGLLYRKKDEKYNAVTGTKGYRWKESGTMEELELADQVDYSYFENLTEEAVKTISQFGAFDWFVSDERYDIKNYIYD